MDKTRQSPQPGHRALRKGRSSLQGHVYHVTTSTWERMPRFADHDTACAACRCFESAVILGDAGILAWVLMPDHAHWLLQLGQRRPLSTVIRMLKAFSARNIHCLEGGRMPVWSRAYHDRALRRDEDVIAVARYIIANPLRAGLVQRIGDYPYWNAVWL